MVEKKKKEEKPKEEKPQEEVKAAPQEKAEPKAEAKAEAAPSTEAPAEAAAPAGEKGRPTPEVLEKLTTIKLREICLAHYPQIVGVSGMKKEELVAAIKALEVELGVREPEKKAAPGKLEAKDLKQKIGQLKIKKQEVLAAKDKKQLKAVRTKIKRLKRRLKKMKTKAA